jgi:hypothetical protein
MPHLTVAHKAELALAQACWDVQLLDRQHPAMVRLPVHASSCIFAAGKAIHDLIAGLEPALNKGTVVQLPSKRSGRPDDPSALNVSACAGTAAVIPCAAPVLVGGEKAQLEVRYDHVRRWGGLGMRIVGEARELVQHLNTVCAANEHAVRRHDSGAVAHMHVGQEDLVPYHPEPEHIIPLGRDRRNPVKDKHALPLGDAMHKVWLL